MRQLSRQWKTNAKWRYSLIICLCSLLLLSCSQASRFQMKIEHINDMHSVIFVKGNRKLLLLPIQESASESLLQVEVENTVMQILDVRMANDYIDYFVPLDLNSYRNESGQPITIRVKGYNKHAIGWQSMELADTFNTTNNETYRPIYHHTPLYGWMNDANGLVYKDGEYHLYFQYNPYASVWGNMHWGHSVSKDLLHWENKLPVIARDSMGHIFSGSSVVDYANTAGYGAGTIIAFYTSSSEKNGQIQCMAYSKDNGYTYTKYEKNPILIPIDGLKDFRDPKVFWYAPEKKWVMIVSADKEMRFYASSNLKNWTYLSAWGEGYGVQPSQFECPDMVQMPINGNKEKMKWVMIVNVNPGCYFGGSATQYFVGDFDGTRFVCDSPKETVKWLDWGKDHYATVCFSNTGDRVIAVPWMSNWQYANIIPTKQFRSANALPRELKLYEQDGEIYMSAAPIKEVSNLRKEIKEIPAFVVDKEYHVDTLLKNNEGAYELQMQFACGTANIMGVKLYNEKGDTVDIYMDLLNNKLVMDRTNSGLVDFGSNSQPHILESHNRRINTSINYINDFALATWGPLSKATSHDLNIFIDKCSVEVFINGGKLAMTNLVFPNKPYNSMSFYAKNGNYKVNNCKICRLEL